MLAPMFHTEVVQQGGIKNIPEFITHHTKIQLIPVQNPTKHSLTLQFLDFLGWPKPNRVQIKNTSVDHEYMNESLEVQTQTRNGLWDDPSEGFITTNGQSLVFALPGEQQYRSNQYSIEDGDLPGQILANTISVSLDSRCKGWTKVTLHKHFPAVIPWPVRKLIYPRKKERMKSQAQTKALAKLKLSTIPVDSISKEDNNGIITSSHRQGRGQHVESMEH